MTFIALCRLSFWKSSKTIFTREMSTATGGLLVFLIRSDSQTLSRSTSEEHIAKQDMPKTRLVLQPHSSGSASTFYNPHFQKKQRIIKKPPRYFRVFAAQTSKHIGSWSTSFWLIRTAVSQRTIKTNKKTIISFVQRLISKMRCGHMLSDKTQSVWLARLCWGRSYQCTRMFTKAEVSFHRRCNSGRSIQGVFFALYFSLHSGLNFCLCNFSRDRNDRKPAII